MDIFENERTVSISGANGYSNQLYFRGEANFESSTTVYNQTIPEGAQSDRQTKRGR